MKTCNICYEELNKENSSPVCCSNKKCQFTTCKICTERLCISTPQKNSIVPCPLDRSPLHRDETEEVLRVASPIERLRYLTPNFQERITALWSRMRIPSSQEDYDNVLHPNIFEIYREIMLPEFIEYPIWDRLELLRESIEGNENEEYFDEILSIAEEEYMYISNRATRIQNIYEEHEISVLPVSIVEMILSLVDAGVSPQHILERISYYLNNSETREEAFSKLLLEFRESRISRNQWLFMSSREQAESIVDRYVDVRLANVTIGMFWLPEFSQ